MSLLLLSGEEIAHLFARIRGGILSVCCLGACSVSAWAGAHVDYTPIAQPNQCLADAVGFQTMLRVQYPNAWSRILKVNWNVRVAGQYTAHAYCIYEIDHQLYAYDSRSGQRQLDLPASAKSRPDVLGQYLGRRYYASAKFLSAFDPVRLGLSGDSATPAYQPFAELSRVN